jgi:phosphoglycerate kinase
VGQSLFTKKTIKDINLGGKTVLLRADYNVPLADGKVSDDYRIKQSLPTVKYLLEKADKLIICSHLGRPKGKVDKLYSLEPVAKQLEKLSGKKVIFVHNCVGPEVEAGLKKLKSGQILLLENLRFHPEEETNNEEFAKSLASVADIFVQDGFGVVHRDNASTDAVTHYLPSVAGFLLEKEVDTITDVMKKPKRPLVAVVGGAKVQDKLEIIEQFIGLADFVAVGGALANPFLVARGIDVEESLFEDDELRLAREIFKKAKEEAKKRNFIFAIPHDVVVSTKADKLSPTRVVDFTSNNFVDVMYYPKRVPAAATKLRADEMILDIGPFSSSFIAGAIQLSETVIWNGTLGMTETKSVEGPIGPYAHGTQTLIEAITGDLGHKPFSVVGGGDTVGYLESRGILSSFNHVSTGGGASLELMSGHKLPGVEALMDKK